jgi:hypothetical protein
MSRFDHVIYDESSIDFQESLKMVIVSLEHVIERGIKCERSKALALTKLEESYMWMGKGIRNDQIARNERKNS